MAAVLSTMIAGLLAVAVLSLPDPAPTLAPQAAANASATGMGNAVTNVLIAFRAMDTMLEKVVLLVALAGIALGAYVHGRFFGRRRQPPEGAGIGAG